MKFGGKFGKSTGYYMILNFEKVNLDKTFGEAREEIEWEVEREVEWEVSREVEWEVSREVRGKVYWEII